MICFFIFFLLKEILSCVFSLDCTVIARGETRDGRFVVGPGRLHFQMIDWTELFEMLNALNIVLYLNLSKPSCLQADIMLKAGSPYLLIRFLLDFLETSQYRGPNTYRL